MPALVLFNRRWRIGSDDFVFPGCFEAVIRIVWLLLTLILFVQHINDTYSTTGSEIDSLCKQGKIYIHIYLIGVMIILVITLCASVLLVIHSARGSIMVTEPRKYVPIILQFRAVMGVIELGWNILGTVWLYSGQVECEKNSPLWIILEAWVICTWTVLPILVITALVLFEPMMRPSSQEATLDERSIISHRRNTGLQSHYIQLWERRCRLLCCTFSRDENSVEAFRNVADVLASVFEESDVVASDIAAALVLLRLKRKLEEAANAEKQMLRVTPSSQEVTMNHSESERPKWMNANTAHYYMKFALGSYGWPWYVYGQMFSASVNLWNYIQCCSCFRSSSVTDGKDNCCMCHTAALRAVTGLPPENIIYISFHNKIYECPFVVAIDDESEKIIIAIRGTMSLHDAITDLSAQSILLTCEGLPSDSRAHNGIVNCALYISKKLEENQALTTAFSRCPNYGLVITGHSLGAGTAVVLAAMLRPRYPDLMCFAFSPPGGLCSMQMSKATQDFVMSVIIGDDLVPRLSINAIHDLGTQITDVLNRCKKPKYRILARGCWYMLFGISRSSLIASLDEELQENLLTPSSRAYNYESIQDIRVMFSEAPLRPIPRHTDTLLFPPGHIMFVTPTVGSADSDDCWDYHWANAADFDQILISPFMLRHHLPQVVLKILNIVSKNVREH